MRKIQKTVLSALLSVVMLTPGCAVFNGTMTDGDVALLAMDLQDVAHMGTLYALAERPEWRTNITLVRDQLVLASHQPDTITFNSLLTILQGLPIDELKSSEGILAVGVAKITLRRIGRNVDLGNISKLTPLAKALADGMSQALGAPVIIQ